MKLSSSIVLEATADAIRKINPDADIITEHYTKKSDGWWRYYPVALKQKNQMKTKPLFLSSPSIMLISIIRAN